MNNNQHRHVSLMQLYKTLMFMSWKAETLSLLFIEKIFPKNGWLPKMFVCADTIEY